MSEINLNGKRVLIFCPSFFGYEKDIKTEVESLGADVSLFDERVFTNTLGKALVRLNIRILIEFFITKFYQKHLINDVSKVDYILLINPETIEVDTLMKCKLINPSVKIIVYMWDSFDNKKHSKKYIPVSDDFYTFDNKDAKKYKVRFLPLFYVKDYSCNDFNGEYKYDFSFVGTAHSERYSVVKKITKNFDKSYLFFYCPSKYVFLYKKYFRKELKGLGFSDVSLCSMNREAVINVVNTSKAIIDISHPSQVGLTMRSIEMLGACRKLITTNINVLSYDFYHPNNILYYDGEISNHEVEIFLNLPYQQINNDIYTKYNIGNWVRNLFI